MYTYAYFFGKTDLYPELAIFFMIATHLLCHINKLKD